MKESINQLLTAERDTQGLMHLLVFRDDGILLYGEDNDAYSVLMNSAVQAAKALTTLVNNLKSVSNCKDFFRFSYDTSSSGIYILPFVVNKKEYYLGAIYQEINNPAVVKCKLRNLILTLSERVKKSVEKQSVNSGQQYLFSNLTDEEIDNLFSFAGSQPCRL